MKSMTAKLTLGPLLFNWKPDTWRDFYFRIADEAEVATVCLGEVVCAKRAPFYAPLIPEVVERLSSAGKEVVFSTLALIMDERDMDLVRDLAADPDLMIEANDMSAVALLDGRPHVIGPFINTYNEGTLAFFAGRGAKRVSLPAELPAVAMGVQAGVGVDLEVQVFGRVPLAISARCYHARTQGLHKDGCRYVCEQDPDGLRLETLDGDAFLAINGTQTLSHGYLNLLAELAELA
jgi:collagenase-like PrtC family protease